MKKNYNYAYQELQKTRAELKGLVPSNILSIIDDSKLTQKSLDNLNSALEIIHSSKQAQDSSVKQKITVDTSASPEDQLQDFWKQAIQDDSPEVPISKEQSNYLVAERLLERYRDDFEHLLKDVYTDIKRLCIANNTSSIESLLSESSWMLDVLPERSGELGILAAAKDSSELLKIIYPAVKEDKLNLLGIATKNGKIDCVKFLLAQDADPIALLGTDAYNNNEVIVELFDKHLEGKNILGKHYKGMFFYKEQKYDEAISIFQKVIDSQENIAICALLYQGFCYQYSKNYELAKNILAKVEDFNSDYYDRDNICKVAREHLEQISNMENSQHRRSEQEIKLTKLSEELAQGAIAKSILPDDFAQQLESYFNYLGSKPDPQSATKDYKNLQTELNEAKYIKIKTKFDEKVVIAAEFKAIPELINHFQSNFTNEDQKALKNYGELLRFVDEVSNLLGEMSVGMIIEDL